MRTASPAGVRPDGSTCELLDASRCPIRCVNATGTHIATPARLPFTAEEVAMINVAIIDDHAIVRSGLKQFLADQVDMRVVAEGSSGRDAVDIVRKGEAQVMLLDVSMPDQNGVDALAAVRARSPELQVLILSG